MPRPRQGYKKLGRSPAHRRATLRNLVTNLLERERITTTLPKARALRPLAEKMITLGKRDTLHSRRQGGAFLPHPPGGAEAPGGKGLWVSAAPPPKEPPRQPPQHPAPAPGPPRAAPQRPPHEQ